MGANCKHLVDTSYGQTTSAKCDINNNLCPYVYYCREKRKMMSSVYYATHGCDVENNAKNNV